MPERRVGPAHGLNEPPPCEQAAAIREQTAELARWREIAFGANGEGGVWRRDVAPVLRTVAGFGARLDALCLWLKSRWPWVIMLGLMVASSVADAAPEGAPKLFEAIGALIGGFVS